MSDISWLTYALLTLVGLVAGTIDAMAGGGGVLTIPALLATNMPPQLALGTNKLQAMFGSGAAAFKFYKAGMINLRQMIWPVLTTLLGAVLGTLLVQYLDPTLLRRYIPYLMLCLAAYFALSPKLSDVNSKPLLASHWFILGFAPLIGFYDGFLGPGTGSFFMLALVALFGQNIKSATAQTKLLNFTSNITSFAVFAWQGHVLWGLGLCMALGQLLGGLLGAWAVLRFGTKLVKPLLVVMCSVLSIFLIIRG